MAARSRSTLSTVLYGLRASRVVWFLALFQLALGLLALTGWIRTGDLSHLDFFCQYEGSLFLLGFAIFEYLMSLAAWRMFEPGEPMRGAWFFITLAAGCRLTGLVFANILSGFYNPGVLDRTSGYSGSSFRDSSLAVSSPIYMALLAIGLLVVLRLNWRVGLLRHLRWPDGVLLAIVGVFLLSQIYGLLRWLFTSQEAVSTLKGLSWLVDPMLGLLLLEAVLIRRSVLNIGGGLIGRCWSAYTVAIFLTSVGNIGMWAVSSGFLPWQSTYVTSAVWFVAGIMYALGPAYQVDAIKLATRPREEDEISRFEKRSRRWTQRVRAG